MSPGTNISHVIKKTTETFPSNGVFSTECIDFYRTNMAEGGKEGTELKQLFFLQLCLNKNQFPIQYC